MSDLDSDLDYVQARVALDAAPAMALLDASSLNTVLAMLEVIDSAEELALLETLTPDQKRQVWNATPEPTRNRLKQLRSKPAPQSKLLAMPSGAEPSFSELEFAAQSLSDSEDVTGSHEAELLESEEPSIELDLSEPLDLEPLELVPQINLAIGDWVVLQAKPQLSAAELMAIWEVLEVQEQTARVVASKLGIRTYPIAWMLLYPKPIGYAEPEF